MIKSELLCEISNAFINDFLKNSVVGATEMEENSFKSHVAKNIELLGDFYFDAYKDGYSRSLAGTKELKKYSRSEVENYILQKTDLESSPALSKLMDHVDPKRNAIDQVSIHMLFYIKLITYAFMEGALEGKTEAQKF